MFKTFITLARGRNYEAGERLADANALTILDQQIRDATGNFERARRALAVAIAQDAAEAERVERTRARIADLEGRAVDALNGGRDDLATQAAEVIARLENDLADAAAAQTSFAHESAKLGDLTANAENRLVALERGRRTARAAEAVRRLRSQGEAHLGGGAGALQDAEATLRRLRERQREDEAATRAVAAMHGVGDDCVAGKLEAAGFGGPTKSSAKTVLDRLRRRHQAAV